MSRPVVVSLTQTCSECPSQWEGELSDGRVLYVRYRWGELTFGIGADLDKAVVAAGEMHDGVEPCEGDWNGYLTEVEMRRALAPHLEFLVTEADRYAALVAAGQRDLFGEGAA